MADETYKPLGGHPPPPAGISNYVFRSIALPGYLVGDIAFTSDGSAYEWDGDSWNSISIGSGGGGSGTTAQFSASSDPSGVPTGNARIWVRLDVGKVWIYNTGTAVWELYLG